ncbi:hypothetical protein AUG19_04060 [archaeon 13_1_20CM_2_54_9]|nr:MAG: hypothetical protein AUG19_04060 [archaeon 13_1_20CM_2_54_9]
MPSNGQGTDNKEPFSFVTMSEYTIDFIEALGLGATNLVGWSDGAIIAPSSLHFSTRSGQAHGLREWDVRYQFSVCPSSGLD